MHAIFASGEPRLVGTVDLTKCQKYSRFDPSLYPNPCVRGIAAQLDLS